MPDKNKQALPFCYNPHFLTDKALENIFVERGRELKVLTRALHDTPLDNVPQHSLLTGSRGIGKTTLLHRLAQIVRNTPELAARWYALTFPEEQYKVANLADFWMNALDALADSLERMDDVKSEQGALDREIRRLQALPLAEREDAALQALLDFLERHQKGVVLLVDGTDRLFNTLEKNDPARSKDGKSAVLWRLRAVLSEQPRLFWIGASYLPLEADSEHQYGDAFLDFFQIYELRPFKLEEMQTAMLKLAEEFGMGPTLTGDAAKAEMEKRLKDHPERLKSLRVLTNGNPRTLISLYNLFAASDYEEIQGDLNRLLDEMTPLYQSKMDVLSDQQRVIFAYLMEAWERQTAQQLHQASGLAVTTINSQLSRLENQGLVEKVNASGRKRLAYQATERLFNIWYLMRQSPRRLRTKFLWLIDFMRVWYSGDELADMAHRYGERIASVAYCEADITQSAVLVSVLGKRPESGALYREMSKIESARGALEGFDLNTIVEAEAGKDNAKKLRDVCSRFWACIQSGRWEEARPMLDKIAALGETEEVKLLRARASFNLILEYGKAGRLDYARLLFDVMSGSGETEEVKFVRAKASVALIHFYCEAGRVEEARLLFDAMSALGETEEVKLERAEASYNLILYYGNADRVEEAQSLLDTMAAFGETEEVKLLRAEASYNLISAYGKAGRVEEARSLLDVMAALGETEEVTLVRAKASCNLIAFYGNAGRMEEARSVLDAMATLGETEDLKLRRAWANNSFGELLQDSPEAEMYYQQAIELDAEAVYPHANLARLYVRLQRQDEAKAEYRLALALAEAEEADIVLQAHLYLGNRDEALKALNTLAKEKAFYRLVEQLRECHALGLGSALADLMDASEFADFLSPFRLALRVKESGDVSRYNEAPKEIADMAREVYADVFSEEGEKR